MKLKLLVVFLFFSSNECLVHGGHMATFTYQITSDNIALEFKIENEVLHHFDLAETCENYQKATAICLLQYITQKTSFLVDNKKITFEMQGSKKDEHFFTITMTAKGDFSNSNTITIENQCFIEFDQKFENRIIVQKGEFQKSYRLDRKHKEIKVEVHH